MLLCEGRCLKLVVFESVAYGKLDDVLGPSLSREPAICRLGKTSGAIQGGKPELSQLTALAAHLPEHLRDLLGALGRLGVEEVRRAAIRVRRLHQAEALVHERLRHLAAAHLAAVPAAAGSRQFSLSQLNHEINTQNSTDPKNVKYIVETKKMRGEIPSKSV